MGSQTFAHLYPIINVGLRKNDYSIFLSIFILLLHSYILFKYILSYNLNTNDLYYQELSPTSQKRIESNNI